MIILVRAAVAAIPAVEKTAPAQAAIDAADLSERAGQGPRTATARMPPNAATPNVNHAT